MTLSDANTRGGSPRGGRGGAGRKLQDDLDRSLPFPALLVCSQEKRLRLRQRAADPDRPKGKPRAAVGPGGALACWICLTGVIESVLNYYSDWRACLSVELPVRQVGREPPARQGPSVSGNERCQLNGFLHAALSADPAEGRGEGGGGRWRASGSARDHVCVSRQATRWTCCGAPLRVCPV